MGHKGKNLSGHEYVCASCQARCDLFLPDNSTQLSICPTCWGKLNTVQRLMITAQFKQAQHVRDLKNIVAEYVHSGAALTAKTRSNEGN